MASVMHGIIPAVVTPFKDDEKIDYKTWQDVIEFLIAAGVDGLFVIGGQGEFFALGEEEREVAARFCIQTAAGRVPVYANVGAITTRATIKIAQKAEEDHVDYLVVVTPYYIRPSVSELIDHYVEVCRSVRTPVLAYSIPERTGVEITPEIAARIAELADNFVGLKDSSGNLDAIAPYTNAGVKVFMGRDHLILEGLKRGCAGAVTACANVAPQAFVDLYKAFRAGDIEEAARLQRLVEPLRQAFSLATFPSIAKEAMNMMGLPGGICRKPVGPVPTEARMKLAAVVEALKQAGYAPKLAKSV